MAAPYATRCCQRRCIRRMDGVDQLVGDRRRYEPRCRVGTPVEHGIAVERSAAYGMRPRSSRVRDAGMWWLEHHRERAMWWYNRIFMPLGVRLQKPLAPRAGMIDSEDVDEVLLVLPSALTPARAGAPIPALGRMEYAVMSR